MLQRPWRPVGLAGAGRLERRVRQPACLESADRPGYELPAIFSMQATALPLRGLKPPQEVAQALVKLRTPETTWPWCEAAKP